MNDAAPFLRARALRKTYVLGRRSIEVLRGVDLTVQRGEFIALRGASGAGKSTLLHLLGGLDLPNVGDICCDGQDLGRLSGFALSRWRNRRVGFIFQAYHLLPELDALENVCLPARMGRMPAAEAERRGRELLARVPAADTAQRARELLARVGLGDRIEHRPYELSGGEQQRVAIARALINSPELLLADEPTGNLDSKTGDEIIELLCALRAEHQTTLIIATHSASVAARAPKSLRLADGLIA